MYFIVEGVMQLSMLSPRVGGYPWEIDWACLPRGREFDMAAILEDWEKLETSDLPSW